MSYIIKRGLAYLIDCTLAYGIIILFIQWFILSNIRGSIGLTDDWFRDPVHLYLYVIITISIPVWIYFIFFENSNWKSTPGKRIFKMKVIKAKGGQRIGYKRSIARTILKLLPWEISHMGVVFPEPVYYMQEADVRNITFVGLALLVFYIGSIMYFRSGQTIYDKALGVKVV